MVQLTGRVVENSADVFFFQVGKFFQDLRVRQARREQLQDVDDAHAHAPNNWTAAKNLGIGRDAGRKVGHPFILARLRGPGTGPPPLLTAPR